MFSLVICVDNAKDYGKIVVGSENHGLLLVRRRWRRGQVGFGPRNKALANTRPCPRLTAREIASQEMSVTRVTVGLTRVDWAGTGELGTDGCSIILPGFNTASR